MFLDISSGAAFLAGLLSFLSPCVLPLVPPYLCYVAGVSLDELQAGGQWQGEAARGLRRKIMFSALAFVLGFSSVFLALGAAATLVGGFVSEYFGILSKLAGGLIIVMGLHFLGVFKISLFYKEARFRPEAKGLGLLGAYAIGLAFAFGWTPCVGPVLAAILLLAGSEESVGEGMKLLIAYAAGLGIPFLLAAWFAGYFMKFMVRFRRHLGTIEKVMGVFLVITGILFLTGGMADMAYWLLEAFPALGKIG